MAARLFDPVQRSLLLGIFTVLFTLITHAQTADAQLPQTITYQGYLTDSDGTNRTYRLSEEEGKTFLDGERFFRTYASAPPLNTVRGARDPARCRNAKQTEELFGSAATPTGFPPASAAVGPRA